MVDKLILLVGLSLIFFGCSNQVEPEKEIHSFDAKTLESRFVAGDSTICNIFIALLENSKVVGKTIVDKSTIDTVWMYFPDTLDCQITQPLLFRDKIIKFEQSNYESNDVVNTMVRYTPRVHNAFYVLEFIRTEDKTYFIEVYQRFNGMLISANVNHNGSLDTSSIKLGSI